MKLITDLYKAVKRAMDTAKPLKLGYNGPEIEAYNFNTFNARKKTLMCKIGGYWKICKLIDIHTPGECREHEDILRQRHERSFTNPQTELWYDKF